MEDQRGWVIARTETEDGLSVLRLKNIEDQFDFNAFPERLNVIWDFQEPTQAGTPSPSESEAMERFEDRICGRIEEDGESILCMVFTEPGYREYVFYSRSTDDFLSALNTIPQERQPYPIEIQHETDQGFGFYQSYAQGLRGAP
ncbi:DUF695 domain-containing protein [Luteimonas sp. BDR2-5]|uniref:DUF695 domain-containing protein n=1 Tax=Proluteimonas luteida TaxID=2878685 RepID=UPI001E2D07A6|nr:DUF695 domain-containing protein [Luteimonas sp. BDR2-5]MCD9029572.1 DUF695 domain-containing protein [Luteimonas sp. BDR2-5]